MYEADFTHPTAVLLGSEGAGLPADLLDASDTRVSIPMHGNVESLNAAVAAAVLLYEAQRQRVRLKPDTAGAGHVTLSR
jgi:tRNA G18 (ribose-2'-O)-methylase SpoU